MTSTDVDQTGNGVVRLLRRALLGDDIRNAVGAITLGIILALCATVILFSLIEPLALGSRYRWSATGLLSVLFWACLVAIAAVYSYSDGGLIDCCAVLLVPSFISHLTVLSVALSTGDPIPIWQWPFDQQFIRNIEFAINGALLWGCGLGTAGFLLGKVLRMIGRITSNRSQAGQA